MTAMKITRVQIVLMAEEKLKAFVTIALDNCFVIHDVKVINGADGLFVAMPTKLRKDGTFKDLAHPLDSETREWMENVILDEYERELDQAARREATKWVARADGKGRDEK